MIKANELRLGNYVHRVFDSPKSNEDYEIIKIAGINAIGSTYVCEDDCIGGLYYLHPIEITEELLLRCGFEKDYDCAFNLWRLNHLNIYKQDGLFWMDIILDSFQVKHLHQLQNLYFALTGKELTINN